MSYRHTLSADDRRVQGVTDPGGVTHFYRIPDAHPLEANAESDADDTIVDPTLGEVLMRLLTNDTIEDGPYTLSYDDDGEGTWYLETAVDGDGGDTIRTAFKHVDGLGEEHPALIDRRGHMVAHFPGGMTAGPTVAAVISALAKYGDRR